MQGRANEAKVQLEHRFDQSIPPVMFDSEGIHRAVLNILTNALDAVEGNEETAGRVLVQTGYDPATRTVFVSIADNGPGIPADQLASIFNLFESTKGARGTGIGLPVSQKIIREHGGEIVVESEPGSGSTFTLEWPVAEEEGNHPLDQTMA
jgi:signal transduction histidine kinase